MSLILMTTVFYKAVILQGEIWYWSLIGLKGLKVEDTNCDPAWKSLQQGFKMKCLSEDDYCMYMYSGVMFIFSQ